MMTVSKFSGHVGILLLTLAVLPLVADASGRKRPASVHLKAPAQKMPVVKKAARPPARRKSAQPVTRPGVITQPAPAYLQTGGRSSTNSLVPIATPANAPAIGSQPLPNNSSGGTSGRSDSLSGPPRQAQRQDSGSRPVESRAGGSIRQVKQASTRKFGGRVFASMKSIFTSSGQQK